TNLSRDVVVLDNRVPGKVWGERYLDDRARDPHIEVAFREPKLPELVGSRRGEIARWPPVKFAAIIAARAAIVIAEAQAKACPDGPRGAGGDASLEKTIGIICGGKHQSRDD